MKHSIFSFLILLFFSSPAWALFDDEPEPLPVEEAFKLKAYAISPNTIRAEWKIEDEHYLYKHRFKFSTESPGITLGEPSFPKGKVKEDEFFGKVETYRKKVSIDIPITRAAGASQDLVLDTVSQGCADIGLCYPPRKESIAFALLPEDDLGTEEFKALSSSSGGSSSSLIAALTFNGGSSQPEDEVLPSEKAFIFSASVEDGFIIARWDIADSIFLYQDKFKFEVESGDGVTLLEPVLPEGGIPTHDELFGDVVVYYKQVDVKIPYQHSNKSATDIVLKASFQGCADKGFCYPPESRTTSLLIPVSTNNAAVAKTPDEEVKSAPVVMVASSADVAPVVSEQDGIASTLANSSVIMIILTFFGFGLLLAFTPCVLPMVPILSSIIVGQGEGVTTKKALIMSIVYVLAMALTYTVAGVIAGLFGANLQAAFQTPWVLITFSIVFVLLSLSMFGFYDLQLPASWQSKLTEISNSQKGGTMAGVAIMGFLSALIVGPCVAAPLMGALIYIGQTGDAVLGGLALFALSMGMGAPLIAIGASAGKLLPKAGGWMESVKAVFGVMLLAVAVWMLERILPPAVAMVLWAILLIVSGIFMGALTQLEPAASGWKKLWKGLGFVFILYGALMLIGAASNSKDTLQPLRGVFGGGGIITQAGVVKKAEFKIIKSVGDLDRELKLASQSSTPVMLDFYADWCVSCKEMERYTFSDPRVQAEMSKAVLLKADVTANDDIDKELLKRFKLIGPPSIIFWNRDGDELRNMRVVGHMDADKFLAHISQTFN